MRHHEEWMREQIENPGYFISIVCQQNPCKDKLYYSSWVRFWISQLSLLLFFSLHHGMVPMCSNGIPFRWSWKMWFVTIPKCSSWNLRWNSLKRKKNQWNISSVDISASASAVPFHKSSLTGPHCMLV